MNNHEWKIHKILDEAKRVYICPARGNCKSYTQLELYAELMAQNKDIKVIRSEDIKKAVDILRAKPEPVLDYDLIDMLERTHRHELFNDYLMKYEPKIITSTTIEDSSFWKHWSMWHALYDGFIVSRDMEDDE